VSLVGDVAVDLTSEQGVVDLDAEIAKCVKKLGLASLNLDKVRKVESQPGYESTVPADVRLANGEKVRRLSVLLRPSLIHNPEESLRSRGCLVGDVEGYVPKVETISRL
jgi:hypothetical protein